MAEMKILSERSRLEHLEYMGECWEDCVRLAEKLIARPSGDPEDENERRRYVFELAVNFFNKHAADVTCFVETPESGSQGGRKRWRKTHRTARRSQEAAA